MEVDCTGLDHFPAVEEIVRKLLKSLIVYPVYLLSLQASSISFMASCNTSNSHHNQAPSSITPSCFLPMTNEPNHTVNYENIYSDCILAWQMCHQSYIGTILYQITATLILASDYGHQLYDRVPLKKWFQWRARQKYEAGRQITLAKRVT